jgi:hypothetical protein
VRVTSMNDRKSSQLNIIGPRAGELVEAICK